MAMNQAGVGLLLALALVAFPVATANAAQPAGKKGGEAAEAKDKGKGKGKDKAGGKEGETAAAAEGETGAKAEGEAAAEGEGEGEGEEPGDEPLPDEGGPSSLEELCKIDPTQCPTIDMNAAAVRELDEEMYATQQIYALRTGRLEINPYFGVTMNDQFVSHNGPGLALNYYITNVIAVGINGNVYHGMNSQSDFNFETSRAARIGMPITEYSWCANANFTYVPAYGKFAGFGDFIFHYDFYLLAGVGAISTRPIAVVDPDNRTFSYEPTVTFGAGGGVRIFFNRWIAAMLEVRDYIFFDRLENPAIVSGYDTRGVPNAQNQDTWLADSRSFTNNVQAQLGLSIFLPFTWEYRLPK
jgi:outer membrane beta-barrel protein